MQREEALIIAMRMIEMIEPWCKYIAIAGSIRRGKPDVKDIELVAIPRPGLLEFLDDLLREHRIAKAQYTDKNGKVTFRWGSKYRGIRLAGADVKCELFLTTEESWGYQFWLRTGPDDANKFIMTRLATAPFACMDGAVSRREDGIQIFVPTETEFFGLLGMRYVEPPDRTIDCYRRAFTSRGGWQGWAKSYLIVEPVIEQGQLRMF